MHIDDRNGVGDQKGWTCWNPREYNIKYICRYQRFGSCGLAEMGFELVVAGVGSLHDAVADDARYDAAEGSEGYEEGLRVPCHADYPTPCLALLPQDRHLSLSLSLLSSAALADGYHLSFINACLWDGCQWTFDYRDHQMPNGSERLGLSKGIQISNTNPKSIRINSDSSN